MRELSCSINYEKGTDNSGFLVKKEASYWIDSQGRIHERTSYGINKSLFKFLFIVLVILALICGCIMFMKTVLASKKMTSKDNETLAAEEEDIQKEVTVEEPTIGEKCSGSYLSDMEIRTIYEQEGPDQLQFYINLIYARHGYVFKKESSEDLYFSKQDWYQKLEKKEVCYEDLNEFERKNVDLISVFLKDEGYRK